MGHNYDAIGYGGKELENSMKDPRPVFQHFEEVFNATAGDLRRWILKNKFSRNVEC